MLGMNDFSVAVIVALFRLANLLPSVATRFNMSKSAVRSSCVLFLLRGSWFPFWRRPAFAQFEGMLENTLWSVNADVGKLRLCLAAGKQPNYLCQRFQGRSFSILRFSLIHVVSASHMMGS